MGVAFGVGYQTWRVEGVGEEFLEEGFSEGGSGVGYSYWEFLGN